MQPVLLEAQAFLATDLNACPGDILAWFVSRWQNEVTFAEVRPRPAGTFTSRLSTGRSPFLPVAGYHYNSDWTTRAAIEAAHPLRGNRAASRREEGCAGLTGSTPLPLPPAVRRAIRGSSAWAPFPDTTSSGGRARGWQLTREDDDRPSADQLPGLCRSPGRIRQARASLRSARPGSSATTACPGWRQAAHSSVR
jgi:hypothetical protein